MTNANIKQKIINMLMELPVCNPDSSKIQWVVRCPYCGDSLDPTHGHFSIKIDIDDDTAPIVYNCFKCPEHGLLTSETLIDLGIGYSPDVQHELKAYNRRSLKSNTKFNIKNLKLNIPIFNDTGLNNRKISYLNDRLGMSISLESAKDYKVILSIREFINYNSLEGLSVDDNILNTIEYSYICFLCSNNNQIVCRSIYPDNPLGRYYNLKIDKNNVSINSFFSINSAIDICTTDTINVHITEGVFDILSVYHNIEHKDGHNIYFASCGFAYSRIIKYLLFLGLMTNTKIIIYADNDKSDKEIEAFFNTEIHSIWCDYIEIHRNKFPHEKDYGVGKDKIDDKFRILRG